jgi:Ca-activated chloride channel family protein
MQRWHLTLLLAVQAAFAAAFLPDWTRATPVFVPIAPAEAAPAKWVEAESGHLRVLAGLDQDVVLAGSPSERYLVLTVDGTAERAGPERPYNIAVVLDRSGSMAAEGKLEFARLATDTLLTALDERDRFALVTFSNRAQVLAASAPVLDALTLRKRLKSIRAGGGTNLGAGLRAGISQLQPHATPETLDRIIVLSDGRVNQGETSSDVLAQWASAAGADGITVSTIGLGLDYNEDLLAHMAEWGGGSYNFVSDPGDLAAIFSAELDRMGSVVAEGVAVEVRPGSGVEILDVLGYQFTATDHGIRIPIGEIIEGESRKVVLKVRLPAWHTDQTLPVAEVQFTRTDGQSPSTLSVNAVASADPSRIAGSINAGLAVLGNQAEASDLADQAVREWEAGNVNGMRDLFASSALLVGEAASRYDSPALKKQAESLRGDQVLLEAASPASREGRYQAIWQKEKNRALAE